MGDTDIFSDMALIAEIHQPRIAMVPIGDRCTMNAATAALAVKRFFKLDAVIPCHYGSFPIIDATADKFVAAWAAMPPKSSCRTKAKRLRYERAGRLARGPAEKRSARQKPGAASMGSP
jgi:L-ascorbate metabolism protein UlaG (beta-lactamase superfamily)